MLIVDGTLVPIRDHTVAGRSKDYRYTTDRQVVIDSDIADGGYPARCCLGFGSL